MTILTETEFKMLNDYVVSNNYTTFSEAHFHHALAQFLPIWRTEQIAGPDKVFYPHECNTAYNNYIKQLTNDTTTNI